MQFENSVSLTTKLGADTSDILSVAAPNNGLSGKSTTDLFKQSFIYRSLAVDVNDVVAIFYVSIQDLLKLLYPSAAVLRSNHVIADLDEMPRDLFEIAPPLFLAHDDDAFG